MTDIWAQLSQGAEPDDWYSAEIRLRRHARPGRSHTAIVFAESRVKGLYSLTDVEAAAVLADYFEAFKRIASVETER
jgi:hypothetical protein